MQFIQRNNRHPNNFHTLEDQVDSDSPARLQDGLFDTLEMQQSGTAKTIFLHPGHDTLTYSQRRKIRNYGCTVKAESRIGKSGGYTAHF